MVGRFHIFDLANQLNKAGILHKIITTYPKFKVKEWGISSKQIVSEPYLELLNRIRHKIPFFTSDGINKFLKKKHDKKSTKYIDECNIFIGLSGSSLSSILEAKSKNKIAILERGSCHYSYGVNILSEEYKHYGQEYHPNFHQWQQELLEYELADYISVPSSFVKRSFVEYGVHESKIFVNPYGVNLSQFLQTEKIDSVFRVVFCGRLCIRKGSHYLLQAMFESDIPNFEFWHIGGISEDMEPFIKEYNSEKIIFKGSMSQSKLYKMFSQCNVFCIPSLEEGMALVQLQAMACGLPLICSTNTGGDDLISEDGREGFVIPIRSVSAIKEKIQFLYDNPTKCRAMGLAAKERVIKGFSWDDYGKRYVDFLNKIK